MRPLLHCDERHRALTTVPRRSARSWSASRNRYRLLAVLTLTALGSFADRAFAQPPAVPATSAAPARPVTAQQMADYRRRLTEYTAARESFEHEAGAYWSAISEKRRTRNTRRRNNEPVNADHYVMIQPPLYRGPSKPADPSAPTPEKRPSRPIPVIRDFLQHASEQFQFTPQRPKSEIEFKRAYAAVAKSAGLTKDQAVRVYGFESGGNGAYSGRTRASTPQCARYLHRARLQSASGGQYGRAARRTGHAHYRTTEAARRHAAGIATRAPHAQDRDGAQDGDVLQIRAGHLERACEACANAQGNGRSCPQSRCRCRPLAADPQAAHLGRIR